MEKTFPKLAADVLRDVEDPKLYAESLQRAQALQLHQYHSFGFGFGSLGTYHGGSCGGSGSYHGGPAAIHSHHCGHSHGAGHSHSHYGSSSSASGGYLNHHNSSGSCSHSTSGTTSGSSGYHAGKGNSYNSTLERSSSAGVGGGNGNGYGKEQYGPSLGNPGKYGTGVGGKYGKKPASGLNTPMSACSSKAGTAVAKGSSWAKPSSAMGASASAKQGENQNKGTSTAGSTYYNSYSASATSSKNAKSTNPYYSKDNHASYYGGYGTKPSHKGESWDAADGSRYYGEHGPAAAGGRSRSGSSGAEGYYNSYYHAGGSCSSSSKQDHFSSGSKGKKDHYHLQGTTSYGSSHQGKDSGSWYCNSDTAAAGSSNSRKDKGSSQQHAASSTTGAISSTEQKHTAFAQSYREAMGGGSTARGDLESGEGSCTSSSSHAPHAGTGAGKQNRSGSKGGGQRERQTHGSSYRSWEFGSSWDHGTGWVDRYSQQDHDASSPYYEQQLRDSTFSSTSEVRAGGAASDAGVGQEWSPGYDDNETYGASYGDPGLAYDYDYDYVEHNKSSEDAGTQQRLLSASNSRWAEGGKHIGGKGKAKEYHGYGGWDHHHEHNSIAKGGSKHGKHQVGSGKGKSVGPKGKTKNGKPAPPPPPGEKRSNREKGLPQHCPFFR